MQEADTTFQLRVEHWNLTRFNIHYLQIKLETNSHRPPHLSHLNLFRYLNMVLESDWHDDVDVARAVHSPHGNIHIGSPYLDPR